MLVKHGLGPARDLTGNLIEGLESYWVCQAGGRLPLHKKARGGHSRIDSSSIPTGLVLSVAIRRLLTLERK
jgi:hypothetical protein